MSEAIAENPHDSNKIDTTEVVQVDKKLNEELTEVGVKRDREEDEVETDEASKKIKVNDDGGKAEIVKLGPKEFESAESMFNYFMNFLRDWSNNLDVNKYEHMVLLDLLKKGHSDADRKIGKGVRSFQIRHHPKYKSRCYFLFRVDGSSDDFSFKKCVGNILPLPENLKGKFSSNGGRGGNGGGKRGGFRK